MKKTKKALASLAIAGMSLSMIPFNVFAASTVPTRLAGVTAEQTAVQIAEQTGYTGAAILASSTSYGMVDALTAGPLAASLKAPILLTGAGSSIDAATKAELTKLAVKTVYVTSGTAVIKQGVIDELKAMGITVEQLGGIDRAATSVNIAKKMTGVTKVAVANTVVDALSIAAVASAANQPILLTDRDALPASVSAYLAANAGITASDVIGGTGVISDAVKAGLPGATRHAGMSAYDTNNQVIQDFAAAIQFDNVYVANGVTGIDALAGAPLAAQTKSPIVLTDGKTVPAVAQFTYSKAPVGAVVTALGGEFVVPETVRDGVAKGQVTPDSNVLQIASISALDATNKYLEISFTKPVGALQTSDITIKDADTQARYGVKDVQMSSNGLTATAELYSQDDAEIVLSYVQDYIVTVNANGTILTATFNRPYSLKVRVQDINVADKEIVAYDDESGTKKTLEVLDSKFDYQGVMGELVQVWYNNDNELMKYQVLTTDAKYDAIEVTDTDEIKLLTEDSKYDISTEEYDNSNNAKFKFYLNGEDKTDEFNDGDYVDDKYNFAKVGFDKSGDIEYVSAYSLKEVLVVDSIDGDEIIGVEGAASGSFNAEDATIIKDGKVIAIADVKEGDVLFFDNDADDGDGFAEVYNNTVTGEIEAVYSNSIKVDGETYDYVYDADIDAEFGYSQNAFFLNEDGELEVITEDTAEELQAAGDVSLYLDHAGNLIYVSGDTVAVDSNTKSAILTDDVLVDISYGKPQAQFEVLLEDGSEELYDLQLEDLDKIVIDGVDHDIDSTPATGADDEWNPELVQLNADGTENADSNYNAIKLTNGAGDPSEYIPLELVLTGADYAPAAVGSLVNLKLDDDGNVDAIEFFTDTNGDEGASFIDVANTVGEKLEVGDNYFIGGNGSKELSSSTAVFDVSAESDYDAADIDTTTWGEYEGSDVILAKAIYNDDNEVVALLIDDTDSDDTVLEEAVITDVLRNGDDEIVEITAYVDGEEKTLEVDEVVGFEASNDLEEGDVAVLEFDKNNEDLVTDIFADTGVASAHTIADVTGANLGVNYVVDNVVVDDVDSGNKAIEVTGAPEAKYRLTSDEGIVLDATDTDDITVEAFSELNKAAKVTVVLDEKGGNFAKFFIITEKTDGTVTPGVESDGTISTAALNTTGASTVRINTDGTTTSYTLTSDYIVLDKDGNQVTSISALPIGTAVNFSVVTGTTTIDVITAVELDGVDPTVTSKLHAAATLTANATHTLVFSEALDTASKAAVKSAVEAAYSGTGAFTSVWNSAGTTLTVTITADATNTVILAGTVANTAVTDLAGNTSVALDLQD